MKQTYKTQDQFRKALDVSKASISRYVRRDDWPVAKTPPWNQSDFVKVQRWRATLQEDRARDIHDADPELRELKRQKLVEEVRKLRAQANSAETALAKERGDLHDADECEEEAVRRAGLVRNGFQNVPTQVVSLALSHGMPHAAAPQFQKQLDELVNGTLRYLASSADAQDNQQTPKNKE